MGKASRRRRKQRRRRQNKQRALAHEQAKAKAKALARVGGPGSLDVTLTIEHLELAKGYDGLLRGMPEPSLVVGLFRVDGNHVQAIGRYLYRFKRPRGFPSKVTTREESKEVAPFKPSSSTRIVMLALAVEEDSGRGLQTLYAALEQGDDVVAWTDSEQAPVPTHLPELSGGMLPADTGHRIHLMFGQHDPSVHLGGDDWIDANLVWTSTSAKHVRYRLHFVSADGRNDWTAQLLLGVRRG